MSATISFFPVGNGDMTLITTHNDKTILIDCNIRQGDDFPDVLEQLREKLKRDSSNRLYIDLFVWSHPDEDHCRGIENSFHLGPPEDWNKENDLIFINEIWSSPMVYRRASKSKESKNHTLSDDAKALNKEVKRRVKVFEDDRKNGIGDMVLILGEDEDGKTDNIQDIVLKLDEDISRINQATDNSFKARLLGPTPKYELDEDEDRIGKNHSSVIFNYQLSVGNTNANFLSGGDAEVICWEALWQRMRENESEHDLKYDVMQAPHHSSWHCLSHDSLSDAEKNGTKAEVSDNARNALGQAKRNAFIISSSEPVIDNVKTPPALRAKEEYEGILDSIDGSFKCVADHKKRGKNVPLEIEISDEIKIRSLGSLAASNTSRDSAVNRNGGDGYA